MEKVIVEVFYSGNNYSAYIPILPGCVITGNTIEEIERYMKEAVPFHLVGQGESGGYVPDVFKSGYELEFKLSTETLPHAYSEIFTKAALSKVTGINERQLWHYAAGLKKTRPAQVKRIETGLHKLGTELLNIRL